MQGAYNWLTGWGAPSSKDIGGVEFWHSGERCGWLSKQGKEQALEP